MSDSFRSAFRADARRDAGHLGRRDVGAQLVDDDRDVRRPLAHRRLTRR